jgi:hypothetical protein
MTESLQQEYRIISNHDFAEVRQKESNEQKALFSCRAFAVNDVVADFSAGTISSTPTYLTVQVGTDKHITLMPEFLQYINHSCNPNVFFDTTAMKLVALREISANEEFAFFYPSAEWNMDQSFNCYCGNENCVGEIKGAQYLSAEAISNYRFTDYINEQLRSNNLK